MFLFVSNSCSSLIYDNSPPFCLLHLLSRASKFDLALKVLHLTSPLHSSSLHPTHILAPSVTGQSWRKPQKYNSGQIVIATIFPSSLFFLTPFLPFPHLEVLAALLSHPEGARRGEERGKVSRK